MKIKGKIKIKDGKIVHLDRFVELLSKLKSDPNQQGKYGYVTVDMEEKGIKATQRNYYWMYLIRPIADHFSGDEEAAHIEMKRKFAFYHVSDIDEIPDKHRDRALLEYEVLQDGRIKSLFRVMWYPGFTLPQINKSIELRLVGYLQSITSMSLKEAAVFMKKVEVWSIDFLNVPIENDAPSIRDDALLIKGGDEE